MNSILDFMEKNCFTFNNIKMTMLPQIPSIINKEEAFMFRHSMREGSVPHICTFCEKEKTYKQYIIGVTNKNGEKYTVTFPESLRHYLEPNPDHPWKLFYYPPQWFINDIMDPNSKFSIPPGDEHLGDVRGVGYLTSLSSMSKQYHGDLLPEPQKCLEEKKFNPNDVVDTHGTDGNLGRTDTFKKDDWLALFEIEPLPNEFYRHLESITRAAFSSYEFDKKLETCCLVQINPIADREAVYSPSSTKPLYILDYKKEDNKWTLLYKHQHEEKEIEIKSIPRLHEILKETDILALSEKKWVIEDSIRMHFMTSFAKGFIPKNYNLETRQILLNLSSLETKADVSPSPISHSPLSFGGDEEFDVLDSDDFDSEPESPSFRFFSPLKVPEDNPKTSPTSENDSQFSLDSPEGKNENTDEKKPKPPASPKAA